VTAQLGFVDGAIVERFDCYEGTSAKAKLSKDLHVQGVNFFARKPARHAAKAEAALSSLPR
jgi:arsenite methyltransferase